MPDQIFLDILNTFKPISLEEMDAVRLMNRQDTKFVMSYDQFISILTELSEYYKILEINGERVFSYNSIYFDESGLSLYLDHHRGKKDRFKVRYRKYLNSNLAFLEVKHKSKGRTDKRRIVVDDIQKQLKPEDIQFIESVGLSAESLKAVLSNRFDRITLVGINCNERLTIDLNLSFQQNEIEKDLDHVVIAELKQEKVTRNSPFYSLMKKHMIRPFRISKYCIGVIELLGKENVKYNSFKKKLLRIAKLNIKPNAA